MGDDRDLPNHAMCSITLAMKVTILADGRSALVFTPADDAVRRRYFATSWMVGGNNRCEFLVQRPVVKELFVVPRMSMAARIPSMFADD